MIIQSSEVSMTSKSASSAKTSVAAKTTYTPCINLKGTAITLKKGDNTEETNSEAGGFLSSLNYQLDKNGSVAQTDEVSDVGNVASNRKVRMQTMNYLLWILFYARLNNEDMSFENILSDAFSSSNTYLVTSDYSYEYEENQELSYEATGTVVTKDGREISFYYAFEMSASFKEKYEEINQTITSIPLVDPLVINLDGNPTSISDQKFYFDLDGDGSEEEISTIDRGSGFLALDTNGDGIINDGNELFGTKSGDGFRDLANYDEDGNGWIDENDSIFSRLRIWTKDEYGNDELYTLKQADVGAIYLSKCNTDFTARGNDGDINGVIRSSGIYLKESTGQAFGVQHVDLAT